MLKKLLSFALLPAALCACVGTSGKVAVADISVSPETLSITEGRVARLTVKVLPEDASDKAVAWSTTDSSVAVVRDGEVTAIAPGNAIITARSGDKYAECAVTVVADVIQVEGLSLDKESLELAEGGTHTLIATVEPENATDKIVVWSTSDESVATVEDGLITAISIGTATITATIGEFTATCSTVVEASGIEKVDMGLSVLWADRNVGAAEPSDYGAYYAWGEVEPKDDYSEQTYKWGNNYYSLTKYNTNASYGIVDDNTLLDKDDDVAQVRLGGKWRMPTDAEIRELVATMNNVDYRWEWKLFNGHYGWEVTYLVNGNIIFIPAAGYMSGTSLRAAGASGYSFGYYWSSSLDLGVYDNGRASGLLFVDSVRPDSRSRHEGLSVRPVYGQNVSVEAIALDCNEISLTEGAVSSLMPTFTPYNAAEKGVTWSSSADAVAVVRGGLVTALSVGSATITATTVDGGCSVTCSISVIPVVQPEKVDLGLPVFWADRNIGAAEPSGYGGYYAWGETSSKYDFSGTTYLWSNGLYPNLDKYNTKAEVGIVDNKTFLDAEDDVARVKLGDKWRLPTETEIKELLATRDNPGYQWVWKAIKGHNGWEVTWLDNGNSIFLPAAGWRDGVSPVFDTGVEGIYLSSSLSADHPVSAMNLDFSKGGAYAGWRLRYNGFSVRAVAE